MDGVAPRMSGRIAGPLLGQGGRGSLPRLSSFRQEAERATTSYTSLSGRAGLFGRNRGAPAAAGSGAAGEGRRFLGYARRDRGLRRSAYRFGKRTLSARAGATATGLR